MSIKNRFIVFFSISLKKGGAENQLVKLALFLKNSIGLNVTIVHFVAGNDFETLLSENKIQSFYYNIKKFLVAFSL